jgi:hypothetical protein
MAVLGLGRTAARATSFTTQDGWQINVDTSVAVGAIIRTSPRDKSNIGLQNGGYAAAPVADDGTLNSKPGDVVSAPLRVTEEVQIKRDEYGLFVRALGFWDPYYDGTFVTDFKPIDRAAARGLGADLRLLDACVFDSTTIAGHRVSFKLGNQAVNWGESTFLLGGINSFSPFNANGLESPGAELREAVLPVPAAETRIGLTDQVSLEAVYEFAWERTRFEPDGTFLSTNDTVSDGGRYIDISPAQADALASEHLVDIASNDVFGAVIPRVDDRHPANQGEFALALRWLAPALNNTEFGIYFEEYASRTPFVDFRTGTAASVLATELQLLRGGTGNPYGSTAAYRADYPGGIKLLGGSFSTTVWDGWGLQGEASRRLDQPLLLSTVGALSKLYGPYLCSLARTLEELGETARADQVQASCNAAHTTPVTGLTGGFPGFGAFYDDWKRFAVTQIQATATKLMDPIERLGISGWTAIGEIGANYVGAFPHDRASFDSLSAFSRSSPGPAIIELGPTANKGLVTQMAAGMQAAVTAEMPDLLPHGIDLQPLAAFSYGFAGRDATGAGYFEEGQAAVTLGATLIWLQNYKLNLSYTNHIAIGPGSGYALADRDFVSMSLSAGF